MEYFVKATVVDLRYKMNDVLKALDRNEKITILYHGKEKGVITSVKRKEVKKVCEHPFFGMHKIKKKTVQQEMDEIRGNRYSDI